MIKGHTTSVHADRRARKRIGIKDPSKMFEDAMKFGLRQNAAKGQFRKYLDKSAIIHKSEPRIYGGYIFWQRQGVLVTVIPLHQKWHKYLKETS